MADEFASTLSNIAASGILSLMITLGHRLNLFNTLAENSSQERPITAAGIANLSKLKQRYVKEWLCCMSAGDIIEVDETGENFWIQKERIPILCGDTPHLALALQHYIHSFAVALPKIANAFREDGPFGTDYDDYEDIHTAIQMESCSLAKNHLIKDIVPLTGLLTRLTEGDIKVLDVGCGSGLQACELAIHFPKTMFAGIDLSDEAVSNAQRNKEERNLTNVNFLKMNACSLPAEWCETFEWVTMFDACHDQTRPDLCLKEIFRVLKKDGVFTMFEYDGTGNVYSDKLEFGRNAAFHYGVSTLHCLPLGSNASGAFCLGTMWGRHRAVKLLAECGFQNVIVKKIPFLDGKILYICRK